MESQPTLKYEILIDSAPLPYNPENLKFHYLEREKSEHAITQVPALRYGIPPALETLSFDIRIPRTGDPRYRMSTVNLLLPAPAKTGDIRKNLSEKMWSKTPIDLEIRRTYTPERWTVSSTANSPLPPPSAQNVSTFSGRYLIMDLEIEETQTSWFAAVLHVKLQKYYAPERLIGRAQYGISYQSLTMTFSPAGDINPRSGRYQRMRVYTKRSGLASIWENITSLWDSGHAGESTTATLHRYFNNITRLTQYGVGQLQRAAGYVTPFISTVTGVLKAGASWKSVVAAGLSGVPAIGAATVALPALYNGLTATFGALGDAWTQRRPDWVSAGVRPTSMLPAGNGEDMRPQNAPLVDCTAMYWGLGWDPRKHMQYIANVPVCELPLRIGVELPPIDLQKAMEEL